MIKVCSVCGVSCPATPEYFARSASGRYGLSARCKSCDRAYRLANRERISEYHRQYRQAHVDRLRAYWKQWYDTNRDHALPRMRANTQAYRNRIRDRQRTILQQFINDKHKRELYNDYQIPREK